MKIKLFNTILLMLGIATFASCIRVDDTLKPSDNIIVSTLSTLDTLRFTPMDTIKMKFLVSTNGGSIKNINLEVDETIIEKLPEKTTFGMVEEDNELTMDENGNLSRDISTVVVEYAGVVKANPAIIGNTFKAVLHATNSSKKKGSNYVYFKGSNIKYKNTRLDLLDQVNPRSGKNFFFDPSNYKAYSDKHFIPGPDVEDPIENADKIKESIALVFGYKFVFGDPNPGQYYRMFSPDSEEAETYMHKEAGVKDYNRKDMKSTVFYRLEGVGGFELDEEIANETNGQKKAQLMADRNNLDWKYFDDNIDEEYLNNLDFSKATNYLVVKGGLYAFKTYDGKKGIFWVNYLNNFDNGIPINIRRLIFEVVAPEAES